MMTPCIRVGMQQLAEHAHVGSGEGRDPRDRTRFTHERCIQTTAHHSFRPQIKLDPLCPPPHPPYCHKSTRMESSPDYPQQTFPVKTGLHASLAFFLALHPPLFRLAAKGYIHASTGHYS